MGIAVWKDSERLGPKANMTGKIPNQRFGLIQLLVAHECMRQKSTHLKQDAPITYCSVRMSSYNKYGQLQNLDRP